MFKRIVLLMAAAALCLCPAAVAEESLKDFPLMASQSPVQLPAYLLDATELLPSGALEALANAIAPGEAETDEEAVYLPVSYQESVGELTATMTVKLGGYITRTVEGAWAQAPSGEQAMRFEVKDAQSAVVSGYALTLLNDRGATTFAYDGQLQLTGQSFALTPGDVYVLYELDGAGRLQRYVLRQNGQHIDASYEASGELAYALITTDEPQRIYYYEGRVLSTIRDDEHGLIAYYDADTGMLRHYTVSSKVEGAAGLQRVTFSPYGDVIDIAYPSFVGDWSTAYTFWSPNFGWYLGDEENVDVIFDIDASQLPDPAAIVPPLPVAEKPEYRTDIRGVADLPQLPQHVGNLPEVLDLQVEEGVATVTLNRSLVGPGAIPALRNRWDPDSDVIPASPTETEGVYVAQVAEEVTADDLCFDIFIPARDLSHFSYGYAYDPLIRSWQVTVFSPAAEFVVDCSPEGRPVTAELIDYLSGETSHATLTFDEETGALTSYDYYLELPFVHRGGWYTFTYIPGRGITSAICGDRSTGRFLWTPENGWTDLVLGTAPNDLFDPLTVPFPYPFPKD